MCLLFKLQEDGDDVYLLGRGKLKYSRIMQKDLFPSGEIMTITLGQFHDRRSNPVASKKVYCGPIGMTGWFSSK